MKKLMRKMERNLLTLVERVKSVLQEDKGQFVVEHAGVFIIVIVLAALALLLMKTFFQDSLWPTITDKITALFNG